MGSSGVLKSALVVVMAMGLSGCVTAGGGKSVSQMAMEQAEQAKYKPVDYVNVATPGPSLIVLPGEIKCATADFAQKVTSNSIADFAEIELSKANFKVLDRSELGPMLNEIQLAVGLGDPDALQKFRKGKFKSTKWFLKFDIVKAEEVARAQQGFDGAGMAKVVDAGNGGKPNVLSGLLSTVSSQETCQIWLLGLRYKILDASTTEQRASGYIEKKMEIGSKSDAAAGLTKGVSTSITLDTLVQQLTQMAVAEIDEKYKGSGAPPEPEVVPEKTIKPIKNKKK
ncbi:MAG: hypothetical protein ACLGPL_05620 [Acidobacteriota bacterium]